MRKRILMIDDEEELCKELCDYLSELGYNPTYAINGHEGLEKIEKEVPELLILDIHMPKMDGLQVMKELIARFPNLRVIILSGVLNSDITTKAIEYGAAICIDKPVNLDEMVNKAIKPLIGEP